jgi:hypothetical protein
VVTTGAAIHRTDVTASVNVNGDREACKDLFIGVEVYDDQDHVIESCYWDGSLGALGKTGVGENHLGPS